MQEIKSYKSLLDIVRKQEEENDRLLIIIQGLPGSGKSTLAKALAGDTEYLHYEADMYFMEGDDYKFNPKKLGEAHRWCQYVCKNALNDTDTCIVSNTFTSDKELEPYYQIADEVGAQVMLIQMAKNYGSIHNVPDDAIKRMRQKMKTQLSEYDNSFVIKTTFNFNS